MKDAFLTVEGRKKRSVKHASAFKALAQMCYMLYLLISHWLKQTTQPPKLTKVNG